MRRQWVINPEVDLVSVLAQYGRFLEDDYRMAIDSMGIPPEFENYTDKSSRKFVIIGAKSVPGATAKSVFLCLTLAGPESLIVKAPTLDEGFLIQNVIDNYARDIPTKVYNDSSDDLKLSTDWRKSIDEATDIVVFGDQNTADAFGTLENEHRRIHIHGPKFSFGIVRAIDLTPSMMQDICFDFAAFYGEGCLSPKFYFIKGIVTNSMWKEFSKIHSTYFGENIDEFRVKLPLTRKSELVQQFVNGNFKAKYIREEKISSNELFATLYGDCRFVVVDDFDEIDNFISKWRDNISTIAIHPSDDDVLDFVEDQLVPRICSFGDMQFPEFFEPFDVVDDFEIYVGD